MRLQRWIAVFLPPLGEPPAFRGDAEDPRPEGAGRYEEGAPMAVRPEMKEIMSLTTQLGGRSHRNHKMLTRSFRAIVTEVKRMEISVLQKHSHQIK